MKFLNTEMYMVTFWITLFEIIMLFFQVVYYLQRTTDKKRLYFLILLVMMIVHNMCSGFMPDKNIPVSIVIQNIIAFLGGFTTSMYFVYYFYKTFELDRLRFFVMYGSFVFLIGPFVLLFVVPYLLTGSLSLARQLTVVVPFLYGVAFVSSTTRAFIYKFKTQRQHYQRVYPTELVVAAYIALLCWVMLPVIVFFGDFQVLQHSVTNAGFLMMTIIYIRSSIVQARQEYDQLQATIKTVDDLVEFNFVKFGFTPREIEVTRELRQGNVMAKEHRNNTVRNYVYAVNRTLDAYQFNILSNKQKFISQIKNSSIDHRKIDEGAFDQEGGMNFGEYVALLSGNTDLLDKVKLEKKLYDLERSYQVFLKRQSEAEFYIGIYTRDLKEKETTLTKLESDWRPIQNVDLEKTPISIDGKPIDDRKLAGELLHQKIYRAQQDGIRTETMMGKLLNFRLIYNPHESKVYVVSPSGMIFNYADGKLNEQPALAGRYMIDSIKRLPKVIESTQESIQDYRKKIETYQHELTTDFKEKSTIKDLKHQLEQLTAKLEKAFTVKEELQLSNAEEPASEYKGTKRRRRKIRMS